MNNNIPISVVMPVYNSSRYLQEAINSILRQSYSNFEFIIVNDGSNDNCAQIIQDNTDKRIKFIDNPQNQGNYICRNIGCKLAEGKYILVMDSDDIAKPDRIEQQLTFMEQHPHILAHGTFFFIGSGGVSIKPTDYQTIKTSLVFDNMFLHPSLMIRKEAMEQVNYYNEQYVYSSDYDLMCKLAAKGEVCNIPKVLMYYRVHPQQITSTKNGKQIGYANYIRLEYLDRCGFKLTNQQQILFTKVRHKINLTIPENQEKHNLYTSLLTQNHSLEAFDHSKFEYLLKKLFQYPKQ